jgi:hypothetical protein
MLQRSKLLLHAMNTAENTRFHLSRSMSQEEKHMHEKERLDRQRMIEVFTGRALLLLFGLGVLGFLVAVDRAEWFSIRPATGTSIAMAKASDAGRVGINDESAISRQ